MESTLRLRPFESAESETGWKDLDWRQAAQRDHTEMLKDRHQQRQLRT